MPPGSDFPGQDGLHKTLSQRKIVPGSLGSSASKSAPGRTGKSKLLDQLPMPPSSSSPGADEDIQDGNSRLDRAARIKRKPSVIGKIAASARISEDGSEWGGKASTEARDGDEAQESWCWRTIDVDGSRGVRGVQEGRD